MSILSFYPSSSLHSLDDLWIPKAADRLQHHRRFAPSLQCALVRRALIEASRKSKARKGEEAPILSSVRCVHRFVDVPALHAFCACVHSVPPRYTSATPFSSTRKSPSRSTFHPKIRLAERVYDGTLRPIPRTTGRQARKPRPGSPEAPHPSPLTILLLRPA
ncbi:hypothetical protein AAT19DRAFT_12687 [Rhodotorula toruloides]|uniref:Uncharacterized protein n=1 Tax=Rhodotorula toruloides TaxID=5286 RepID=A0A2T0AGZ4_RHOTO|nr:hypothetical protein AAT19DRAFT_12687 [Rhodotorula toruloides]